VGDWQRTKPLLLPNEIVGLIRQEQRGRSPK
jgi:hypothetical protein